MGFDACRRVEEAISAGIRPNENDVRECNRWRSILEFTRRIYWFKLIPQPFPPPGPSPFPNIDFSKIDINNFFNIPQPDPADFRNLVFGELFLDVLRRGPTSTPSIFNDIIESGAQLAVVEELSVQFEEGAKFLRAELDALKKNC